MVDTLRGNAYDMVSAPVFSSDGSNFAYTVKKGSNNLLIVNHKQNLMLDASSNIYSIQFSSDNKSLSYILFDGKVYSMVFHGVKGNSYDAIDENSIVFTKDGSKIAYSAVKNNKQLIVFEGVEGPMFDKVGFPLLAPEGNRLAYWASEGNQYFVMCDNKKSAPYEYVYNIVFSNEGGHMAYHASRNTKHIIVKDGVESEWYQMVHSPTFSPDGSRFVYAIEIVDEKEKENHHYAMIDGVKNGPYETVVEGSFIFSDNGKNLAFEIENDDRFAVVFNGKQQTLYSDVMQATQIFSPDQNHYAYVADRLDTKRIVNIDGIESKPYDDAFAVAISPDSKKYIYSVRLSNKEFVVADGHNGAPYETIFGQGQLIFDGPNSFHYMAMKNNAIYLVEESFE